MESHNCAEVVRVMVTPPETETGTTVIGRKEVGRTHDRYLNDFHLEKCNNRTNLYSKPRGTVSPISDRNHRSFGRN